MGGPVDVSLLLWNKVLGVLYFLSLLLLLQALQEIPREKKALNYVNLVCTPSPSPKHTGITARAEYWGMVNLEALDLTGA